MCPIAASEVTGCSKSNNYRESMTVQTFPLLVKKQSRRPLSRKSGKQSYLV